MIKLLTTSVFKGQILEYLKVVATINQETIIYILYVRNRLFKRNMINVALGFEIKLLQERVKGNGVFHVEDE